MSSIFFYVLILLNILSICLWELTIHTIGLSFWLCSTACGILVPWTRLEPGSRQSEHWVLTVDCQGIPPQAYFSIVVLYILYSRLLIRDMICKCFLSFCGLSFTFLKVPPFKHKHFQFYEVQLICFLPLVAYAFGVTYQKRSPNPRSWKFTPMFSSAIL